MGKKQASIADCTSCTDTKELQDFFLLLFLTMKDKNFKNDTVKFLHKKALFVLLMHVGICRIHSLAAYIHCCFYGVLKLLSPPV